MTGTVNMGGGFNGSARAGMSDSLQRRLAAEEVREAQENAHIEHQRELLREELHRRAIASAIQMAAEAGEAVDVRRALRGEGIGHTPGEFIALASARQDLEDARVHARQEAAYRKWLAEQYEGTSADTTAPTPVEVAEGEVIAERAANYRRKRRETSKAIVAARNLADHDRRGR